MDAKQRCDFFLDFLNRSTTNRNWDSIIFNYFLNLLKEKERKEENGESIVQTIDYVEVINQIISHLENEGFIKIKEITIHSQDEKGNKSKRINTSYSLTIAGQIFISSDGYKGDDERETKEREALQVAQDRADLHDAHIRLLTVVIAFGTAVAAIYYIFEMLKWYFGAD